MSTLRCAMCRAELIIARDGDTEAWVCPTGHGVALTPAGAPAVEPGLSAVWARAEGAAPGIRHCPRCDGEMAVVSVGQDAVKADACARCEVLWLDSLELAGLSHGEQPESEELVVRALSALRSRQAEQLVS